MQVTLYWQVFPASGMMHFPTLAAAAQWSDELLRDCPTATVIRER